MGVLVLGGLAERFALRSPLVPVVAVGVIVLSALGCLLAQTLLMEIGFVIPQHFWAEYLHTLRVAIPLAVVFGLGAMVHGSLRGRVQLMEGKLHEKKVTEKQAGKLGAEERLGSVQSLVENAVKHGITPQSGGGEILVTASAENSGLRIEVRDTGPGFDLAAIPAGHGLDSLVERLDALYGAKARLNFLRRDGYSVVEMVL